jgi:O-antigen/teichoic acid export membrane protein
MSTVIESTPESVHVDSHRNFVSKLLSGAASLSASQVARRVFRALFLLLAARLLGPEVFGLYVLIFTVMELLALISGAGFADYLTREVAKSPNSAYRLLFQITQLRLVYLMLLAAIVIPGLSLLKYSPYVVRNAALLSVTLVPRAIAESSQGIIRAMHRFSLIFWIELLQGMVLLGTGGLLLIRGWGLRGVIWADIASIVLGALVALPIALRLSPNRTRNTSGWRQTIRDTFVFNLYPLIVNTYDRVDVVLLSKLVGNAAVGIYSLPYRLYAALSILPYGIMGTLLPSLSKSSWGQDEKKRCSIAMQLLYAAALFLILASMLLADVLVRSILGPGYHDSAAVLKILAWATIPTFMNYALNIFLLARNQERVFLRTAAVCTVLNISANLVLIPRYSYFAAAAVTILTEIVLLGQNVFLIHKSVGYVPMPRRLLWNTVAFAVTSIAAYGTALYLPAIAVTPTALAIFAAYLYAANGFVWSNTSKDIVCAS